MKIGFVLNDIATEKCGTSVTLLKKAHDRGHDVVVMSVGDFSLSSDLTLHLHGVIIPKKLKKTSDEEFLEALQKDDYKPEMMNVTDLDVLFVRNNPTEEPASRHWAEQPGIAFGRMAQNRGVIVLNDAYAMSNAFIDKLYFEELPPEIKPKSLTTRKKQELLNFWEENNKMMVLKPLEGSGGQNVFLIDKTEKNLNQILDTIMAEGYVIAQEYLPAVSKGDVRVFMMNGRILERDGKPALLKRKSGEGEFRNNLSQGGSAEVCEMTKHIQRIADLCAPKLIKDGFFLVGLDVVKDKLIEINVLSPGGMRQFPILGGPDFAESVMDAIERKVEYKKMYNGLMPNHVLATMH